MPVSRLVLPLLPVSALLGAFPPSPALARDRVVGCTLEVDGRTYLDEPCLFSPETDGSFSIGTGDAATAKPFFAYVTKNDNGTAEAYWNEDAAVKKAQTPLGTVRQHGACWTNKRARICAE